MNALRTFWPGCGAPLMADAMITSFDNLRGDIFFTEAMACSWVDGAAPRRGEGNITAASRRGAALHQLLELPALASQARSRGTPSQAGNAASHAFTLSLSIWTLPVVRNPRGRALLMEKAQGQYGTPGRKPARRPRLTLEETT